MTRRDLFRRALVLPMVAPPLAEAATRRAEIVVEVWSGKKLLSRTRGFEVETKESVCYPLSVEVEG